ncbi:hypothetical protein A2U01_0073044, partial [Trifolium medium]|nr:hypothetical protein [Trifolium medium]
QDESLRNYIERFNKEVVQVNTTDNMKKYLLEQGLHPRSDFVGSQIPLPRSLPAKREARRRLISTGSPEDHPTCSQGPRSCDRRMHPSEGCH